MQPPSWHTHNMVKPNTHSVVSATQHNMHVMPCLGVGTPTGRSQAQQSGKPTAVGQRQSLTSQGCPSPSWPAALGAQCKRTDGSYCYAAAAAAAAAAAVQALGKLKLAGWGFKRSDDSAAAAAAAADRSSTTQMAPGLADHPDVAQSAGSSSSTAPPAAAAHSADHAQASHQAAQQGETPRAADAAESVAAAATAAAADGGGGGGLQAAAPFDGFLLCLDQLVQHSYSLLRDQLKRRLTPLLADCISPENNVMTVAVGDGCAAGEQPLSPSAAGAAVAGSAAESPAHAEAALMNYRR